MRDRDGEVDGSADGITLSSQDSSDVEILNPSRHSARSGDDSGDDSDFVFSPCRERDTSR